MEKYGDIALVIFDFDGTIAHFKVDWESLRMELREYFKRIYGFESDFSMLYREIDRINDLFGRRARDEALAIIEKHELTGVEDVEFIPETMRFIENLRVRGVKLAIFSCNTRKAVERTLMKANKLRFFESIVTLEDVSKTKPDPEGLYKILSAFKVSKSQILLVGDKQRDLEAGVRAGIKTVLIKD